MSREETLRLLRTTGRGDSIGTGSRKGQSVGHGESDLQRKCVKWFRRDSSYRFEYGMLLNSVPNGARVRQTQARVLLAEGLTAGVADLELNVARGGWHGLKIEMKREWVDDKGHRQRSYQREEQREWQALVEREGYRYAVVRTEDEFKALIIDYLK